MWVLTTLTRRLWSASIALYLSGCVMVQVWLFTPKPLWVLTASSTSAPVWKLEEQEPPVALRTATTRNALQSLATLVLLFPWRRTGLTPKLPALPDHVWPIMLPAHLVWFLVGRLPWPPPHIGQVRKRVGSWVDLVSARVILLPLFRPLLVPVSTSLLFQLTRELLEYLLREL